MAFVSLSDSSHDSRVVGSGRVSLVQSLGNTGEHEWGSSSDLFSFIGLWCERKACLHWH